MQNESGFKNRLGIIHNDSSDKDDVDLKSLYSELSEFEKRIQHLENIGRKRASIYGVIGITLGLVIGLASIYISYYLWMDIVDISKKAEERENNIHIERFMGEDGSSKNINNNLINELNIKDNYSSSSSNIKLHDEVESDL